MQNREFDLEKNEKTKTLCIGDTEYNVRWKSLFCELLIREERIWYYIGKRGERDLEEWGFCNLKLNKLYKENGFQADDTLFFLGCLLFTHSGI